MKTIEGYDLDQKVLTLLQPNEAPKFAARPSFATVRPPQHWDATSLLLTDKRMLISKDRLFGKAKADFAAQWSEVSHVEGVLWNGGGPQIQILVSNSLTMFPIELIVQPQYAVEVESAIRAGYLNSPR
jgi:hypothetical protein